MDIVKVNIVKVKIGKSTLRIKDCNGISSIRGLMFDSLQNYDGALIYANAIWMPFVKYGLDLVFLDKDFRVTDIQTAVPLTLHPKTWRIYSNDDAKYCLEIKAGKVRNLKTLVGKKIEFNNE